MLAGQRLQDRLGSTPEDIKAATDLPVIVGFGIKTPEAAQSIAAIADGCVVGSAIVSQIGAGKPVAEIAVFVKGLADGAHRA